MFFNLNASCSHFRIFLLLLLLLFRTSLGYEVWMLKMLGTGARDQRDGADGLQRTGQVRGAPVTFF